MIPKTMSVVRALQGLTPVASSHHFLIEAGQKERTM